jgi:NAD(P)-dependent dehydrogenase (short-subunit alcohol dehydrogenase family)
MGRAAALAFAREGAPVVGCDRNVDAAEAAVAACTAGGTMVSLQPCQLNKPAELAHTSAKAGIIW